MRAEWGRDGQEIEQEGGWIGAAMGAGLAVAALAKSQMPSQACSTFYSQYGLVPEISLVQVQVDSSGCQLDATASLLQELPWIGP